jgi:hypothetical protein
MTPLFAIILCDGWAGDRAEGWRQLNPTSRTTVSQLSSISGVQRIEISNFLLSYFLLSCVVLLLSTEALWKPENYVVLKRLHK